MVSGQCQEWEPERRERGIPGAGHPNGDAGCPHQKVRREGKQKTKAEKTPFTRLKFLFFSRFLRSLSFQFFYFSAFAVFASSLFRHFFYAIILLFVLLLFLWFLLFF